MTKISTQLFIDGTWTEGTGAPFASRNPGSGNVVWEGASASAEDVEQAVLSARRAFASWSALTLDAYRFGVRRTWWIARNARRSGFGATATWPSCRRSRRRARD